MSYPIFDYPFRLRPAGDIMGEYTPTEEEKRAMEHVLQCENMILGLMAETKDPHLRMHLSFVLDECMSARVNIGGYYAPGTDHPKP
jgi:hypothetical protein